MSSNIWIAMVGIATLVTLGMAIRWQRVIWAIMFLVVFEGALRKWVFPGFQAEIYFVKDALLLSAYFGFLLSRVPSDKYNTAVLGLRKWVLVALFYFAVQVVNPNSPSMLLSLLGLKNYMLYMPLAFVVPHLFASKNDLEEKLRRYAILMIPFAALGIIQFMFPPDHWLNAYLSYDDENIAQASLFGTAEHLRARAIGTFSYIGGFVTFLTVMLYLAVALIAAGKWKFKGNYLIFALVGATVGAMLTTGSRTPFYGLMITAPLLFGIWKVRGLISTLQVFRLIGLSAVLMLILQFISPEAIDAYRARAEGADDTITRIVSPFAEPYGAFQTSPILGLGIGSAQNSAATVMQSVSYWWLGGNLYEVETARVLQETGIIGLILVYGCRIWLLARAIGLAMQFRTPLYIALSTVIAGFFLQYLYLFVINNPTAGIYYWFCAGVLFAMCRLESKALAAPQGDVKPDRTKLNARTPSLGQPVH